MKRSLRLGAAAALAAAAFTSGCSVGPAKPPSTAAPVELSPFTLPSPEAVRPRAPLTGLETEEATKSKTAVIVPIEVGTGAAAPVGLDKADVVELEFAEGKLLRVAAVYQSTPRTRSARSRRCAPPRSSCSTSCSRTWCTTARPRAGSTC
ncbi:DUF3048 domain-containing protein [Catellatospora coxensis]